MEILEIYKFIYADCIKYTAEFKVFQDGVYKILEHSESYDFEDEGVALSTFYKTIEYITTNYSKDKNYTHG
jgi:hypothetical protein